jgi:hypothetical protein
MNRAIGFYKTLPEYVVAWIGEELFGVSITVFHLVKREKRAITCHEKYIILAPNAAIEYTSGSQPVLEVPRVSKESFNFKTSAK